MKIDDLLAVANGPLIGSVARLNDEAPLGGGCLESQLRQLLHSRNGFYAFESALHVFPAGVKKEIIDVETWNAIDLWRYEYGDLTEALFFFAEDIFGGQFCLAENGIYAFDPETAEREWIADDIENWAAAILDDFSNRTGYPLAHEWQTIHGSVSEGTRLAPRLPFVAGGAFSVENLYCASAVDAMRFRGNLACQIHNLPDGAKIQLKPTP
ncbi:MAG TPA: SMI1/KNR4 family protein [Thermoanaerobaculia bacterium]|jgi:hypothetical protein|nr:SMI1/KNR4 family protein [Thermoanaerobaculia bacterium]